MTNVCKGVLLSTLLPVNEEYCFYWRMDMSKQHICLKFLVILLDEDMLGEISEWEMLIIITLTTLYQMFCNFSIFFLCYCQRYCNTDFTKHKRMKEFKMHTANLVSRNHVIDSFHRWICRYIIIVVAQWRYNRSLKERM